MHLHLKKKKEEIKKCRNLEFALKFSSVYSTGVHVNMHCRDQRRFTQDSQTLFAQLKKKADRCFLKPRCSAGIKEQQL